MKETVKVDYRWKRNKAMLRDLADSVLLRIADSTARSVAHQARYYLISRMHRHQLNVAPLKKSTIRRKRQLGVPRPARPLIRFGDYAKAFTVRKNGPGSWWLGILPGVKSRTGRELRLVARDLEYGRPPHLVPRPHFRPTASRFNNRRNLGAEYQRRVQEYWKDNVAT